MLPFLKPKAVAGLIISKRTPDGDVKESHQEENEGDSLDACSEALIRAITSKDAKAVSAALRDAQEVLSLGSSEESSASPHTYDAQNALAARKG